MIKYRPVKMRHPNDSLIYGIIGEEYDETGNLLRHAIIPHVSGDYITVLHIVTKCNDSQLELEHFLKVVLDLLR